MRPRRPVDPAPLARTIELVLAHWRISTVPSVYRPHFEAPLSVGGAGGHLLDLAGRSEILARVNADASLLGGDSSAALKATLAAYKRAARRMMKQSVYREGVKLACLETGRAARAAPFSTASTVASARRVSSS